ncbi:MAG: hypothetical protein H6908_02930 [Hyphomicrobiales bacterium]|nr:hypothetical protein [Hyphomicrobiales bacterium]
MANAWEEAKRKNEAQQEYDELMMDITNRDDPNSRQINTPTLQALRGLYMEANEVDLKTADSAVKDALKRNNIKLIP